MGWGMAAQLCMRVARPPGLGWLGKGPTAAAAAGRFSMTAMTASVSTLMGRPAHAEQGH